jgi:SDR family mycofactocin-dependent oxidoreductase
MAGRVAGKVALITGAARGQGRAHALRLAQEGADIIAVDVCAPIPGVPYLAASPADLKSTVAQVESLGRRIISAELDVRDLEPLRAAVNGAVAELGRLDIIIANAGICIPAPWHEVTEKIFVDILDINVRGVWNTVMAGARHVVDTGGGSIILISSAAGLKVQPFLIPYTTSKFAVRGMAKAFAAELARHHIRVNSVHPTGVDTPMMGEGLLGALNPAIERDPRLGPMLTNMLPVDFIEPDDVADTVLFLASDESRYMTAHELAPDAGVSEF